MCREEERLRESRERTQHWKRWGPYISDRAWGTVREDYSPDGSAWDCLTQDQARLKSFRWNEDGIGGICDRHQLICFSIALWNGRDPFLKERLFGLPGNQGNHGEDVKEYYFYLDSTPTHSYMKFLYKYPQTLFPYKNIVDENQKRGRRDPEYELLDTGVFDDNRYFDVFIEYAKADVEDILIQIKIVNRGLESSPLHLIPTIWYRNTWSWGDGESRPHLRAGKNPTAIEVDHPYYGMRRLYCEGNPELLFTENDSNLELLYGVPNATPFVKDGIDAYIVRGIKTGVNPAMSGTKAAAHYSLVVESQETKTVRLRFCESSIAEPFQDEFSEVLSQRAQEADDFYQTVIPEQCSDDARNVMRQSFAGLLWSKQFYHYVVDTWLRGDPAQPPPPPERKTGRNHEWIHLYNADVISMPDKWEYPWYAAWDLAFHCIPLALVDPDFTKEQLILFLREWYMHPNGQIPAYEWGLGDVNPPVHAWAAWRVYKIEKKRKGTGDVKFLERVFHKLLLNFTWWVNRKDTQGNNIFEGGFLGLDNIGVFDRSAPLPTGGFIEQSDGTSWMAMYTLNLLAIAMELARIDPAYEDVASKFLEHFVYISTAMNTLGLWNDDDGFYYDVLHMPNGYECAMKVRSMVGLIPLFAVETLEEPLLRKMTGFTKRLEWFVNHRSDLTGGCACMVTPGVAQRRLLAIANPDRLRRVLQIMLDENEFLSPYGIRSLSRAHAASPFRIRVNGREHRVDYEPAESSASLFGGNSNWRGPIWFPVNFLMIEALQKFHHYLGRDFQVECPTGSGQMMNLWEVAAELSRRLTRIFLRDPNGRRPVYGGTEKFQTDPHWRDHILFYEYFHGDNGAGLGASHQTGWTALVAKLLQQSGEE